MPWVGGLKERKLLALPDVYSLGDIGRRSQMSALYPCKAWDLHEYIAAAAATAFTQTSLDCSLLT